MFSIQNVKSSPLLSKEANDFLATFHWCVTPSRALISELPLPLRYCEIKSLMGLKESCKFLDEVLNFDVKCDDVFVCSLPKCGSSWMHAIVWLLMHDLNYTAIENIDRDKLMGNFDQISNVNVAMQRAQELCANDNSKSLTKDAALSVAWNEMFDRLKSPRVIKSHYPAHFLPKATWTTEAKVIYVVRNPKDMAVSLYHFIPNFYHFNVTMDDIVNGIINDLSIISPHLEHIQNFWKLKYLPNVFIVHYEDLVNNPFESFKRISEFLRRNYTDEQLSELVNFSSFENMKQIKTINREDDVTRMESRCGKKRRDADFK